MKRTIPHPSYEEPTDEFILERFEQIGFQGTYSPAFVRDMANYYSWIFHGSNPQCSLMVVEEPYDLNIQGFLGSLNYYEYTGFTPLEKAASIVAAFSALKGSEIECMDGDDEGIIPLFMMGDPEKISGMLNHIQEEVVSLMKKDAYKMLLEIKDTIPEIAISHITAEQLSMVERLAIVESRGRIRAARELPKRYVQPMAEYSQVTQISNMSSMVMPYFDYKFATKQLFVSRREQATMQCLVFLIDLSWSMKEDPRRQSWVQALMTNRCQAVLDKKAQLYVIGYREEPFLNETQAILTRQDVEYQAKYKFLTPFENKRANTRVSNVLTKVYAGITDGKLGRHNLRGTRPQVVVLCDGEDALNPTMEMKFPTHFFMLGPMDNDGMRRFAAKGGGTYERFNK